MTGKVYGFLLSWERHCVMRQSIYASSQNQNPDSLKSATRRKSSAVSTEKEEKMEISDKNPSGRIS